MLEVRAFDPEQDDAIESWEATIGADRMLQIHRKDDPEKRLKEVQLNPKNTRQFRALLREGTTELVTYTRVKDREAQRCALTGPISALAKACPPTGPSPLPS